MGKPKLSQKYFSAVAWTMAILGSSVLVKASSGGHLPLQTLRSYEQVVIQENLELRVERAKTDAQVARAGGINLPPPVIGFGKESVGGDSADSFELNQEVPFPTKLTADREARKYESESQKLQLELKERELRARARVVYFNLWSSRTKASLLAEKKTILLAHVGLARSTARGDSFATIHLLKAENDCDLLEAELLDQAIEVQSHQVAFCALINQSQSICNTQVEEPDITDLPTGFEGRHWPSAKGIGEAYSSEQRPLSLAESAMMAQIRGLHEREREARASWWPDFSFRFSETQPLGDSGRNQGYMLSVSLPFLFFWSPEAATRTALTQRLLAEADLRRLRLQTQSDLEVLVVKAKNLKKQMDLLNTKVLPRLVRRAGLIHNIAPRDLEALQDHREASEAIPDLKLRTLALRLNYESTVAELIKLVPSNGENND